MIDPLDEFLGYRLRRASGLMMADLAQTLDPTGLRLPPIPTAARAISGGCWASSART
jgi:hypothetical protein